MLCDDGKMRIKMMVVSNTRMITGIVEPLRVFDSAVFLSSVCWLNGQSVSSWSKLEPGGYQTGRKKSGRVGKWS